MKRCASANCPAENPQSLSCFHRNRSEKGGYHRYCKVCRRTQASAYTRHKREYDAARYAGNPQAAIERAKERYLQDPEPVKARVRKWQQEHPERCAEHRVTINANRRSPAGRAQGRKDAHKRRVRIRQGQVEDFADAEIFERDGWVCRLCLLPVDPELLWPHPQSKSLDHVIPVFLGGPHTRDNTQLAHLTCNIRKGLRERREVVPGGSRAGSEAPEALVDENPHSY